MKKIIIILALVFSISFVVADCRLFMMAGYGNETLLNQYNSEYLEDFLDELQDQGGSSSSSPYWNSDGWGLGYYLPGDTEIASVYRSDNPAFGDPDYNAAQTVIQNAGAHLVIGHVRKASSGSTGIPDPNPFIWNEN